MALWLGGVAALALAFPAGAFAAHDLKIYKAEKQVDLTSDDTSWDVSCKPGDFAIDGMWRLDHSDLDPDADSLLDLSSAVDVWEAYPSDTDTYHFRFNKNAIGRVQMKIWVTCLGKKTDDGIHTLVVSDSGSATASLAVPNALFDSNTVAVGAPPAVLNDGASCPAGYVIASPGYQLTGDDGSGGILSARLASSFPFSSTPPAAPSALQAWRWQFVGVAPGAQVKLYSRCLKVKYNFGTPSDPHKHKLTVKFRPTGGYATDSIPDGTTKEVRRDCNASGKAMIGAFYAPFDEIWFWGMDPRIKQRAFKFSNTGGAPLNVRTGILCLEYQTT